MATDGTVWEQAQICVTQSCPTGRLALPSVPDGPWWFIDTQVLLLVIEDSEDGNDSLEDSGMLTRAQEVEA